MKAVKNGAFKKPRPVYNVNNHIHTSYSFSPYSPTKAVWMAYIAGLQAAGIMDHDSVSGVYEFIEAGRITGIATTAGVELRVNANHTRLAGRRINCPDQNNIMYIAIHGIPHTQLERVKKYFIPYSRERKKRNKLMVKSINKLLRNFYISIDFKEDVLPLSKVKEGGSITERHLLFALAKKIVHYLGKGKKIVDFLKNKLHITINKKIENFLLLRNNEYYEYDLLSALKSNMISKFYINTSKECPSVKDVIRFTKQIGAISAYAYLGDITKSVTGDKKAQTFEDSYLDLLFEEIKRLGFNAVTYMPSRNSFKQIYRIKSLCQKYGFFEICGEDINSPRQSFICKALKQDEFKNLFDATYAMIGHEIVSTGDITNAMFGAKALTKWPDLKKRIEVYKEFMNRYFKAIQVNI